MEVCKFNYKHPAKTKGLDEKIVKSKWPAKTTVVLLLMEIKF